MAKKKASFKSLPKRSKAAAFAKMSTAGKLKKKDKSGKRTGAAISAKGASSAKPKATAKPKKQPNVRKSGTGKNYFNPRSIAGEDGKNVDWDKFLKLPKARQKTVMDFKGSLHKKRMKAHNELVAATFDPHLSKSKKRARLAELRQKKADKAEQRKRAMRFGKIFGMD